LVRVGVVAASGYIGGELLRLLLQHPRVELTTATARKAAGDYVFRVHPNLRGVTDLKFSSFDPSRLVEQADLIFAALPHGESVKFLPDLAKTGIRIVDLSADFRLTDPEQYRRWYGYDHPAPELLKEFVFSIPELNREQVKGARLASSPGCMAITSILAIVPLLRNKALQINREHIVVDAKVGSSGAGGKPSVSTHFSERFNVVRPYKPAGHRHSAEIEQAIESVAGEKVKISMSAHAVNMVRGILSTCHLFTDVDVRSPDVWKAYRASYSDSPFIRLVKDKQGPFRLPDPKLVVGSNFCDVGFEIEERTRRIVALAATDNLIKGAAGNAVQTMNLMLGFDERAGLQMAPLHPV
jgi:N-acetyl-gamma-glutamyl-phosphate/LysW-gamma-L-alpha-aminoadipyl-6-phosphate reductase